MCNNNNNKKVGLEQLSKGIFVQTGNIHRFGTDAFLLSHFASPKQNDLVCDLGTGCGIIPMLFQKGQPPRLVYGVDIQEDAIAQLKASLTASEIAGKVVPICADLRKLTRDMLPLGEFNLVTCNPPYKVSGGGILSEVKGEQIARHETMCTIDDVCKAAFSLLNYGGRLCICQRPERLCDVMVAMRANRIEPKRLRMVAKTAAGAPWLFLIEGQKCGKPFMKVLPMLCLYEGQEYTEELKAIYRGAEPAPLPNAVSVSTQTDFNNLDKKGGS